MRIEHTIDIAAPAERVWALTVDVESWPELSPTMTAVERLDGGPLRVGSTARVKQPGQRAKVWTVTAVQPGRPVPWRAPAFRAGVDPPPTPPPAPGGPAHTPPLPTAGRARAAARPAGASDRPGSVGRTLMDNLSSARFAGRVMPVNRHHGTVGGLTAYRSVASLPETPDLAIVAIRAAHVAAVVGVSILAIRIASPLAAGLPFTVGASRHSGHDA